MARRIPRVFINELLARTDIVDLIDRRLKLKKQGKNFHARCPFHHEKTPSFSVSGAKQFYHCFGCGAHGNAIDFLMNYDRLEFIESIEELAAQHCLKVPYEGNSDPNQYQDRQKQRLYHLMSKISCFYKKALNMPTAIAAHRYLQQRGLSQAIITHFSIGFSPQGWNNIIKNFCHSTEDYNSLKEAGMLIN